jgi:hypothetical protein
MNIMGAIVTVKIPLIWHKLKLRVNHLCSILSNCIRRTRWRWCHSRQLKTMFKCGLTLTHQLMRSLLTKFQKFTTSGIWVETISQALSKIKAIADPATLCHISNLLSQGSRWKWDNQPQPYQRNRFSLATIWTKAARVDGLCSTGILLKMVISSQRSVVHTVAPLTVTLASSMKNAQPSRSWITLTLSRSVKQTLKSVRLKFKKKFSLTELSLASSKLLTDSDTTTKVSSLTRINQQDSLYCNWTLPLKVN